MDHDKGTISIRFDRVLQSNIPLGWIVEHDTECRAEGCDKMVCITCHQNQTEKFSENWRAGNIRVRRRKASTHIKEKVTPRCTTHWASDLPTLVKEHTPDGCKERGHEDLYEIWGNESYDSSNLDPRHVDNWNINKAERMPHITLPKNSTELYNELTEAEQKEARRTGVLPNWPKPKKRCRLDAYNELTEAEQKEARRTGVLPNWPKPKKRRRLDASRKTPFSELRKKLCEQFGE